MSPRLGKLGGHRHRLEADRWHHLAGVFDVHEVRLYVDGGLAARRDAAGSRTAAGAPLVIGALVQANGIATAGFKGAIDEVRLSRGVRYAGESFSPSRRHDADETTMLLLHMDGPVGPWLFDGSRGAHHAARYGARVEAR